MMRAPIFVGLLVAAALAGCNGAPPPTPGESADLDTIVPGTWNVSSATDFSLVWAHNSGSSPLAGTWSLAGLPASWNVTFNPPAATLQGNGSGMDKTTGGYKDWGHALATLKVPADATGTHQAELRFGSLTRPVTISVKSPLGSVSRPGDQVTVSYDGHFHGGERFDEGGFDTTLGSGQTVPGFDSGLIGLALNEKVTLVLPPALGYGYDQTTQGFTRFNGKTLDFTVSLTALPEAPAPARGDALCAPHNDVNDPRAPFSPEAQDHVRVRFETTLGNFTVETDAAYAPRTVANFLQYVDDGFFACTTFHRVAPGFVVQGGGFLSDYATHKKTRDPIPLEATTAARNLKWTLSMARTGEPDSATSEFFVNLADNRNLDPTGPKTGYAVFAHLVEGQDTITKITQAKAGKPFGAGGFYPKEPIVIIQAHRL